MQSEEKQKLLSEEYLAFLREIAAEVSDPALQARITDMISKKMRTSEEIPSAESNPWVKFAGVFQDDPLFDDFVENMAAYRQELDAEIAAYNASLEEKQSA
ncbi:MAG: hypothetical protein KAF91_07470 [Nostoc sp. TH1S01]|nr:hypothetical protein [Nostoc sp. TH1S01]